MVITLIIGISMLGAIQILYIQQFLYVLSLTVYSINTEKNLISGRENRMCVLDYIKNNKLPNLQLFHVFYGGKEIYEIPEKA